MEIKFGATDDGCNPPPMPSSSYSVLPNQGFNVGTLINFRPRNDIMVGGTSDVNLEALVARVIEKRKIKEELLTYGNLNRRRELENEAINELILEGGLALRQPEGVSLMNLANHSSMDGRLFLGNHPNKNITDGLPFQHQPGVTNEAPCKPVIDLRKAVLLPKTATSDALAGSKRKFETPDDVAAVVSSKKIQQGWSCELCQVTTTDEQGLKNHLKGKKHKAKEKTMQRTATTTTSVVSDQSNKSEPPIEATDQSSELAIVRSGNTSTNISNIVSGNEDGKIVEDLSPKKQSNGESGFEEKHETEEFKNIDTHFRFWCKMCEAGTTDEASMTAHRTGEKHMSLLMEKGGGVITIKTIPDDVQYVDLRRNDSALKEKEVSLSNVDEKGGIVEADEVETTEKCTMEAH